MSYRYLLPGSEFHDKIRTAVPDIDNTVCSIFFKYSHDVIEDTTAYTVVDVTYIVDTPEYVDNVQALVSEDGSKMYVVSEYDIKCLDCQMMFYRMKNLSRVVLDNFNTDDCSSMRRMFMGCTSLKFIDMSNLSSRNVSDFTEMFSGCSSCLSIDVSNFQVPSTAETCVFSDMFKDVKLLRRLSVGKSFIFAGSMNLADPDVNTVPGTNGRWNFPVLGTSYSSSELSGGTAGTYYAVDVLNDSDTSLVTLESLRECSEVIGQFIRKKMKYMNVE